MVLPSRWWLKISKILTDGSTVVNVFNAFYPPPVFVANKKVFGEVIDPEGEFSNL